MNNLTKIESIAVVESSESQLIPSNYVLDEVESIHRNYDDFEDGDLAERILEHDYYKLVSLSIDRLDLDEWDVDEYLVDDIVLMIRKNPKTMPPIVIDGNDHSIIDGIHRANAYDQLGIKNIPALISV